MNAERSILNLDESLIRAHSTAQSFERGQDYTDAVFDVIRRGDWITASRMIPA